MQLKKNHLRIISAFIVGFFFACFGVFLFSDFQYRGLTLRNNVLPLITGGTLNSFMQGIWVLLGSGFIANWFLEFSLTNIANSSVSAIFWGETIWPAICTWFLAGFFIGVIIKGMKRGILLSISIVLTVFLFWVISGIFAGADITAIFITNIGNTLSELFTVFISLIPGGILGGLISGPYQSD